MSRRDVRHRLLGDLAVSSAPRNVRTAGRASLCLLVSLLILWASGRTDLALYATFGAFASVYDAETPALRWRAQAGLGLVLTAAVATGVLVSAAGQGQWLPVVVAGLWAGLAAALSDHAGWRPAGPLFPTFAVAACGSVPVTWSGAGPAVGTAAATAVLAVVLGVLELAVMAHPPGSPPPRVRHPPRRRVVQAVRCGGVVVVAGLVATQLDVGHPYWAMVAAVVPLSAPDVGGQVYRGLHRVVGTTLGLALAALLLLLSLPVLALVVVAAALQGLTELVVARYYAAALFFITPLALLLGQLAHHQSEASLLRDRFLETLLGVAVGVTAAVVTRDRSRAEDPSSRP